MGIFMWLAVALVMAVIEAVSLTLITVWFIIGGLAAFLAALAGADFTVQTILFVAVSIVSLVLFRPLALRHRAIGEQHEASPIGTNAVVIETIDNDALCGRIETPDHMTWAALSADGSVIQIDEKVRVVDQQSIKLIVERI